MTGQPMDTAPRDGTVISVKNRQMDSHVEARWGKYTNCVGNTSDQWILVKDHQRFMPLPPGAMICPDEWWPLEHSKREDQ